MNAKAGEKPQLPYEMIGGREAVHRIVNRFYDLMENDPRYAALRALHAEDLTPMRASLSGFLTGWLGGPRDWFDERPGVCVMSAHAQVPIDSETARQWMDAMAEAMTGSGVDPALAAKINEAFAQMATGMKRG